MNRKWFINRTNPEFLSYISKAASVSPLFAQVLINRGIKSPSAAQDFLDPGLTGLSDPFGLPGMKAAVERIKTACSRGERVLVHGDYDTDGLTATALMVQTLRTAGLDVLYFIPNRTAHGYGFNPGAVEMAREKGAKLIITVDCGITSFEAAAAAKAAGIDLIITDHHEPMRKGIGDQGSGISKDRTDPRPLLDQSPVFLVPDAVAVVNPKLRPESGLSILSGAGVAFKAAQALALEGGLSFSQDDVLSLMDLAALGTVADVVPLVGENRAVMKEGLRYLNETCRPGLRALREVCGMSGREIKTGLLAFTLVPRLNAAGRMADASDVVRLLLTGDYEEALGLSSWLDGLNKERQKIEEEVYQEAVARLDAAGVDSVILLAGEGWHQGVLGIVASRIAEEFYRPAFVLSIDGGIAKGSARSIPSFDLCGGLAGCSSLLLSFGGHKQAAGLRLKVEDMPGFEKAMGSLVREGLGEDAFVPSLNLDAVIPLKEVTHGLVKELEQLEPFGCGNEEPLFGSRELEAVNPRIVGKNHVKMRLRKHSHSIDAIGFDMGELLEHLGLPSAVDAAFTPSINEWNGGRYLQLVLRALRPSR